MRQITLNRFDFNMLSQRFKNKKILLGSQSPRRRELLEGLGLTFETVNVDCDESYPSELTGGAITEFISKSKSLAYGELKTDEILITADTIVWLDGEKLGKPKTKEEAVRMLSQMSGRIHEVFSSASVRSADRMISVTDCTEVSVDPLSKSEIEFYVEGFRPYDKAGSYAIQEWLGLAKIPSINGSFYTVMGLPTEKLYAVLSSF